MEYVSQVAQVLERIGRWNISFDACFTSFPNCMSTWVLLITILDISLDRARRMMLFLKVARVVDRIFLILLKKIFPMVHFYSSIGTQWCLNLFWSLIIAFDRARRALFGTCDWTNRSKRNSNLSPTSLTWKRRKIELN